MSLIDGVMAPLGYEQVTALSAAVGLASIPAGAKVAILQAETENVRWRDDGSNPTAAVGMILPVNDYFLYNGKLSALKFIEVAASAKLNVLYY